MSRYANGQPVRLSTTVRDLNGNLVDAGTLTLTVAKPDASQQVYSTPSHDSTGAYHQDVPAADLATLGHYQYKWVSVGTGAGVSWGELDVFDPLEPSIITLQDAKSAVNINPATTAYDAELQVYVDTVTASLETITGGPAFNRSVSEYVTVSGDLRDIVLRQRPVVSVTSITDVATGLVMPIADIDVDLNAGIVRRKLNLAFWSRGTRYQVVYVAGWGTSIPAAFNAAARVILSHLWETERGPGQAPVPSMEATFLPGMSYAIPNRALELLRPYAVEVYV